MSFAFEIERANAPVARSPYLSPAGVVSFQDRLTFLGAVVEGLAENGIEFTEPNLRAAEIMRLGDSGAVHISVRT